MKAKSVSLGLTIIGLVACGLWQAWLSEACLVESSDLNLKP